MTDIGFYHLTRTGLDRALPKLLEKVLASGVRAVVVTGSAERVEQLSTALWTYDPASFLPHGTARDGEAAAQPIWLTDHPENPNGAGIVVLTEGATVPDLESYQRCLDLFDGRDEAAVADARTRWSAARAAGHTVAYWQQNERGGWERKA
ncbi:MAG: DNA polymerase III subunit chi [Rhodospirillales bacterium]